MSELSSEELTKIIIKAYGALIWKFTPTTPKGKNTRACNIRHSEDFQGLIKILTKQHGIDLSNNRRLVDDSLSAVNPFPQKKQ